MDIYVVCKSVAGYAREDASQISVVGAYEDPVLAEKVRKCAGHIAVVSKLTLGDIPKGYLEFGKELGVFKKDEFI